MNSKPKSQRSAEGSATALRVRKSTRRKRLNRRSGDNERLLGLRLLEMVASTTVDMTTPTKPDHQSESGNPDLIVTSPSIQSQDTDSVLSMMERSPDSSHDPVQDFLTTGRTGRRNAMPDILGEHASTTTADLPDCLRKLDTSDASTTAGESEASTSGAGSCSNKSECPAELPVEKASQEDPSNVPDGANS